ncbi:MAG TPA: glycosyltransferase [Candidatus Baltobacteraceae bacterium]
MDDRIALSIVIPAYKEAHKIAADVEAADAFLATNHIGGEIILVDDGSPDGTAQTARDLQRSYSVLRVVSYQRNRGKGHAIAVGMAQARGDFVMFADAGLCVPYDVAVIGLKMLELDMCDIAHGSRRMRGSIVKAQPFYRRLGSQIFRMLVYTVVGIPSSISDTQCGFKIYRRPIAQHLFGQIVTDGFMFDIEVILRALKEGHRILEFPVLWSNDADTRFNPGSGSLRNLKELAHIRWALTMERGAPSQREAVVVDEVA